MAIKHVKLDTIDLAKILEKNPGDPVASTEWNKIFNLIVTQGNTLSDNIVGIDATIQDILNGRITGIVVDTNVTQLGGKPAEAYALKAWTTEELNTLKKALEEAIKLKMDKQTLSAERVVLSTVAGGLESAEVSKDEVNHLKGVTSNVQQQLNGKLGTTTTAYDTARVNGRMITVSQTAPANPGVGDLWIDW